MQIIYILPEILEQASQGFLSKERSFKKLQLR